MQYSINQLCQLLLQKVYDIYDVFKNFFGEEYVDLQSPYTQDEFRQSVCNCLVENGVQPNPEDFDECYFISSIVMHNLKKHFAFIKAVIYVWWPKVTVTNEYNKSIVIQDLYAEVEVHPDGLIPYENTGFLLNRATYTQKQFSANYLHSHIHNIPKNAPHSFQSPCLGNGPIGGTILTLKSEYDEAAWMLFCQELSMYVTVESIQGGPWRHLESVGGQTRLIAYADYALDKGSKNLFLGLFSTATLQDFVAYYLQHGHLSLSYKDNAFTCLMPYHEFIVDLSNSFIAYYNKHLATTALSLDRCFNTGLLCKAVFSNGTFYHYDTDDAHTNYGGFCNRFVLNFKGKPIYTKIISDADANESSIVTLIHSDVAMFILNNILRTINFRYENEYNKNHLPNLKASPATSERVIFI